MGAARERHDMCESAVRVATIFTMKIQDITFGISDPCSSSGIPRRKQRFVTWICFRPCLKGRNLLLRSFEGKEVKVKCSRYRPGCGPEGG